MEKWNPSITTTESPIQRKRTYRVVDMGGGSGKRWANSLCFAGRCKFAEDVLLFPETNGSLFGGSCGRRKLIYQWASSNLMFAPDHCDAGKRMPKIRCDSFCPVKEEEHAD